MSLKNRIVQKRGRLSQFLRLDNVNAAKANAETADYCVAIQALVELLGWCEFSSFPIRVFEVAILLSFSLSYLLGLNLVNLA